MNKEFLEVLCDPYTKEDLIYEKNRLINKNGQSYSIINGIPVLLEMSDSERNTYAINLFEKKAPIYDKYQHLSFETFFLNEEEVRKSLINKLGIKQEMKVLELSAGTGRDSILIKERLNESSQLFVQDISMDMLNVLRSKFQEDEVFITQSNASALPYKEKVFDAVYSFAGVGMSTYSDTKQLMKEIVRVCKKGAKVVLGGLSMAPWLYDSEFGKILINHNTHYANVLDLKGLPIEARNVSLSWILNGAGFCIEFEIGEGEPEGNFDFQIPGERGGTLRTRYYGKLEGVAPEVKELAYKARAKKNISMYDFINTAIKESAEKILEEKGEEGNGKD